MLHGPRPVSVVPSLICAEAVGSLPPAPTLTFPCLRCVPGEQVSMISRPQWLVSVCQFETSPCSQKSEGARS